VRPTNLHVFSHHQRLLPTPSLSLAWLGWEGGGQLLGDEGPTLLSPGRRGPSRRISSPPPFPQPPAPTCPYTACWATGEGERRAGRIDELAGRVAWLRGAGVSPVPSYQPPSPGRGDGCTDEGIFDSPSETVSSLNPDASPPASCPQQRPPTKRALACLPLPRRRHELPLAGRAAPDDGWPGELKQALRPTVPLLPVGPAGALRFDLCLTIVLPKADPLVPPLPPTRAGALANVDVAGAVALFSDLVRKHADRRSDAVGAFRLCAGTFKSSSTHLAAILATGRGAARAGRSTSVFGLPLGRDG